MKSEKRVKINGVIKTAMRTASKVIKNVSLKNCPINCKRLLPMVLRMPISLARCDACAVVKLIKLIHPNNNRNAAITINPYKVVLFAAALFIAP